MHLVEPGRVYQFEPVPIERGLAEGAQGLMPQVFVHPTQARGVVNLPGAGVDHRLARLGGAVVLHQHGFDQGVTGLAVGRIGLEFGLVPLVHDHGHQVLGRVDEVHGVEGEIADRGVHHDGVGHRIVVDAPALVNGVAVHDLLGQRQPVGRVDGGVGVEPRDIGQHKFVEFDRGLIDQALLPVAGEGIGNDLAHGVPLSEAANTSWFMSMRA
ncbi:hypothetical protein D3C73_868880 [compost metagenome]